MAARFKRAWVLLLSILILAGMAYGAFAASSNAVKEKDKLTKNPKQTVGKNWGDKPGNIRPNGTATPKKNLFKKNDSSSAEEAATSRLGSSNDAPVGPDKKTN